MGAPPHSYHDHDLKVLSIQKPMSQPPYYPSPPKRWFAWLMPTVFIVNIAMFIYSLYLDNCPARAGPENCILSDDLGRFAFVSIRENPLLGPSVSTLRELGALDRKLVLEGQTWRLMSCIWLHAGVIHVLANMISLVSIGFRQEKEFGFLKIGVLYFLSGLAGSLLSCLKASSEARISVGASGALFGLLGAMLSEFITNWSIYDNKCSAFFTLIFIVAINLGVGLLPHVDNSAHIGGFVAGFLLGFVLLLRPQYGYVSSKYIPSGYDMKHKKPRHKCYQYVLLVISLVLLIIGYAEGIIKLLRGDTIENLDIQNLNLNFS